MRPLSFAASLGLALALAALAPTPAAAQGLPRPPSVSAPAHPPARLLTWNVGTASPLDPWGPRLPRGRELQVAVTIASTRADVVTLQELRSPAQAKRLRALLAFFGRPYRLLTASADASRDDGKTSAILFRGPARAVLGARVLGRYEIEGVVLPGLTVINAHTPATSQRARHAYCEAVARMVRSQPTPVVAAGDFNLGPKHGAGLSAVLPWLRRRDTRAYQRLRRAFDDATDPESTTAYGFVFDHVLVRGGAIRSERTLPAPRLPQDHRPLLVRIQPTPPAPLAPDAQQGLRGRVLNASAGRPLGSARPAPR